MSGGRVYAATTEPWQEWRLQAKCYAADGSMTSVMYPLKAEGREVDRAKAICANCPVRVDCLDFAMRTRQEYGVWGGLTEAERRKERRRRQSQRRRAS